MGSHFLFEQGWHWAVRMKDWDDWCRHVIVPEQEYISTSQFNSLHHCSISCSKKGTKTLQRQWSLPVVRTRDYCFFAGLPSAEMTYPWLTSSTSSSPDSASRSGLERLSHSMLALLSESPCTNTCIVGTSRYRLVRSHNKMRHKTNLWFGPSCEKYNIPLLERETSRDERTCGMKCLHFVLVTSLVLSLRWTC